MLETNIQSHFKLGLSTVNVGIQLMRDVVTSSSKLWALGEIYSWLFDPREESTQYMAQITHNRDEQALPRIFRHLRKCGASSRK